jgi:hypothetical protein
LFVLIAASVDAQTDPQAIILSALSDCIRDAIASSSVKANDDLLIFSCSNAKAKILYNFLGNKIPAEAVLDRNGKIRQSTIWQQRVLSTSRRSEWQSYR